MTTITKKKMCHLLYCLNWHIKELHRSACGVKLPEHEWEALKE